MYLQLLGVSANQECICPQTLRGFLLLARGCADHRHLHPKGLAELDGHMAEPPEADDAEVLPWLAEAEVLHGGIHRDAGAQQRGALVERHALREPNHEVFLDDDRVGVAAVGHRPVGVDGVVGEDESTAVVLRLLLAAGAGTAGVHHATHAGLVSYLELVHLAAHISYDTHNLMPAEDKSGVTTSPYRETGGVQRQHAYPGRTG